MSQPVQASPTAAGDTSRRTFLDWLFRGTVLAGAAGFVSAVVGYLFPTESALSTLGPQRLKVGSVDEFAPGEGKLALLDDHPVWVLNLPTGFAALSALCTHRGCTLRWEDTRRLLVCPCHEGQFDERGNVVSGLPRRPLPHVHVGIVAGEVYVSHGTPDAPV